MHKGKPGFIVEVLSNKSTRVDSGNHGLEIGFRFKPLDYLVCIEWQ